MDVHKPGQPAPDHHVSRRRAPHPPQAATQLGDRREVVGHLRLRRRARDPGQAVQDLDLPLCQGDRRPGLWRRPAHDCRPAGLRRAVRALRAEGTASTWGRDVADAARACFDWGPGGWTTACRGAAPAPGPARRRGASEGRGAAEAVHGRSGPVALVRLRAAGGGFAPGDRVPPPAIRPALRPDLPVHRGDRVMAPADVSHVAEVAPVIAVGGDDVADKDEPAGLWSTTIGTSSGPLSVRSSVQPEWTALRCDPRVPGRIGCPIGAITTRAVGRVTPGGPPCPHRRNPRPQGLRPPP